VRDRRGFADPEAVEDVGPVNVVRVTGKAALVETSGGWKGWIPFSTILEDDLADVGADESLDSLRVAAWFVEKNEVE